MFNRFRQQLLETPEENEAPKIREWCRKVPGAEDINQCRPHSSHKVAGVVESIKLIPRPNTCMLEVQIFDGTDEIRGVWYGRRSIPGIDLGSRISMRGTIAVGDSSDGSDLRMINPAYELLPA